MQATAWCAVIGLLTWIGISEQRSEKVLDQERVTQAQQFLTQLQMYATVVHQATDQLAETDKLLRK